MVNKWVSETIKVSEKIFERDLRLFMITVTVNYILTKTNKQTTNKHTNKYIGLKASEYLFETDLVLINYGLY